MADMTLNLTGVERKFEEHEIIVSKTDLKGHLTYVNDVFLRLASYSESDCLGQPHNMIRNPEMPRCIFKLLWDTIGSGAELFAYVVNRSKNGDHYWVLAHVTPSFDANGQCVGYHSNRRVPKPGVIDNTVIPLYKDLLAEEMRHSNRKDGLAASSNTLSNLLAERKMEANEFALSL